MYGLCLPTRGSFYRNMLSEKDQSASRNGLFFLLARSIAEDISNSWMRSAPGNDAKASDGDGVRKFLASSKYLHHLRGINLNSPSLRYIYPSPLAPDFPISVNRCPLKCHRHDLKPLALNGSYFTNGTLWL